jgi:histidine triad (HIT) family protein
MSEYAKLMGIAPPPPCPFCEIIHGRAPGDIVERWPDTIALRPLNPVVDGHLLVIPRGHVDSALSDPAVTGLVAQRAAELGRLYGCDLNLITSIGSAATQTVRHLHWHVVPRVEGDGLSLPWTPRPEAVTVDA